MLNSLQYVRCSFIFTILFVPTTTPTISNKSLFLYFSQFALPYCTLTCSKIILTIPTNTPFQQSTPKNVSQFRLRQGTKELQSLLRSDPVLISPFVLKVCLAIKGLTVTDSLSFRLKRLVYCRY